LIMPARNISAPITQRMRKPIIVVSPYAVI
jgi:hypothetical protein